jgi:lipopolysaccharide export system permease protein
MFVLLVCLIDLFVNLVQYLNYGATMRQILVVSVYYIPKSFTYALPISLLFAVAYTLGDLYARNELTTIITAGIPYRRLTVVFVVIGVVASFFAFYFEDYLVIPTYKIKNDMARQLRHQPVEEKNSDIVLKTRNGDRVYAVDYYDYRNLILNGVIIIEKDSNGRFLHQIRAHSLKWNDDRWIFNSGLIYEWEDDIITVKPFEGDDSYNENPEIFRRSAVKPEDLSAKDAAALVEDLKAAGLPYLEAQADLFHRYSFPAVSFIVIILSIAMGGRFKKNILLMTLLTSILSAVGFYVVDFVTMILGKQGYISPLLGAWTPVLLFTVIGFFLITTAKT